jgi:hypothetical protein
MNSEIVDEIIEELSSSLQRVETQSAALMEFVKEKKLATDHELAAYLERASAASSVRWRATRVRLAHLLSGLEKSEQRAREHEESSKKQAHREGEQQQDRSVKPESQKPREGERIDKPERSTGGATSEGAQLPDKSRAAVPAAQRAGREGPQQHAQEADKEAPAREKPEETKTQKQTEAPRSRGTQANDTVESGKDTKPSDGSGRSAA